MTLQQNRMKVLNDNLKIANELYTKIAYLIHERVTDCWGDEQAKALDAQIVARASLLEEKLRNAHEMASAMARPLSFERK